MTNSFIILSLAICITTYGQKLDSQKVYYLPPGQIAATDKPLEKLKFVILCFNFSKPVTNEITDLNNLAREYDHSVSSVVINDSDLSKYKELFTVNEYTSLKEFIAAKSQYQKHVTSFPVILILDHSGKIMHSWSGDKTDDGLKSSDFYTKIKAGLESISIKN